MFISVLICTRHRAQSLRETLESIFVPHNLEEPDWDVVVVYNGVDVGESRAVCQDFQAKFPTHFRFLVEKRVGKSHALNTGLAESMGDLIAMTDDDVRCGVNYIRGIRTVFRDYRVHGVQGRVLLDCEGGRPIWMNEEMASFMSLRDCGDEVLEWPDNLTGANMVVRRDVVRAIGGFSPAMGAGASGFMEDSEFSMRVRKAGFRLIYAPQIVVWHKLPAERLTPSFFLRRYFGWGRSQAYLCPLPTALWRFGCYALKEFALSEGTELRRRLTFHSASSVDLARRCKARHALGFSWQHWLLKRGAQRTSLGHE